MTGTISALSLSARGTHDRPTRSVAERTSGASIDVPQAHRAWLVAGFLLGAIAGDSNRDPGAVAHALERALDLDEPDQVLLPFLVHRPPGILDGRALTRSETRVLHYLPTNLSSREIAADLCLSVNTVRTHLRHLYQKLEASGRGQAVEQARAIGLLAPSVRTRIRNS